MTSGWNPPLEVAVARQHSADGQVALGDLARDRLRQRSRVADGICAAVTDEREPERFQRFDQARALQVFRDDLGAGARRPYRPTTDREVLTQAEFRNRSVDYWLFETGAGAALIAGAALGMIVGVVIVAQTLYSSTKDHLNEFATLRALGASAGLHPQGHPHAGDAQRGARLRASAWRSACSSSGRRKDTTLLIVMTPGLAVLLFALDRRNVRPRRRIVRSSR